MISQSAILDEFRAALNLSLAVGELSDFELLVTDVSGDKPVVVALANERLEVLLGRLRSVGGFANVFVLDREQPGGPVSYVPALPIESVIDTSWVETLSSDEKPSPHASIGMFLEFLKLNPAGVSVPVGLADKPVMREGATVNVPLVLSR